MTWDAVHDQLSADIRGDHAGYVAGLHYNLGVETWSIARTAMQFDTTSLAGKTILSVAIELYIRQPAAIKNVTVHIVDKGTIVDSYPFSFDDYSKVGSTSFGHETYLTGVGDNWYRIELSPAVIAQINTAGNTIICAREAHDLNDVEPAIDNTLSARALWFFDDMVTPPCRLIVRVATPITATVKIEGSPDAENWEDYTNGGITDSVAKDLIPGVRFWRTNIVSTTARVTSSVGAVPTSDHSTRAMNNLIEDTA